RLRGEGAAGVPARLPGAEVAGRLEPRREGRHRAGRRPRATDCDLPRPGPRTLRDPLARRPHLAPGAAEGGDASGAASSANPSARKTRDNALRVTLLPLREKVAREAGRMRGSRRNAPAGCMAAGAPSSGGLRPPPSPARGEGT